MPPEKFNKRAVAVPDNVEIFQFAEVGFGSAQPDLAVIRIVSKAEDSQNEYWFALSRVLLAELGRRFVLNAQSANVDPRGLN
jgi:hypothetical protein